MPSLKEIKTDSYLEIAELEAVRVGNPEGITDPRREH